jgi:hypothetical protein
VEKNLKKIFDLILNTDSYNEKRKRTPQVFKKELGDMSETILWGWKLENDDRAHGTFDSKEEALEDAQDHLRPGQTRDIEVGRATELEAADYVTVDSDELLDNAAQQVFDDYGCESDRLFDFVSTDIIPAAVEELHKFMREWAGKYLYNTEEYWVLDDVEKVTISKEALEDDDDGDGDDEDEDDDDGDGDGDDDYDDSEDDEDSDEEDEGEEEEEEDDESEAKEIVN